MGLNQDTFTGEDGAPVALHVSSECVLMQECADV